ncbi:DUF2993 domain-containing protein [Microcoleus sp. FACHB-672]|uniref:LmeA family phospholipid-binding protein n=1 Tax=Microcoleus sp. FACHB-672 TaxID=2692825 RepID=UPI0016828789|nr:DUF2993 domain-containing protein [Microcoleus sp. FACHB-672]MBD2043310.1 DUF2993 domain-containing protein [Microcoleus sp. FACHB-672]
MHNQDPNPQALTQKQSRLIGKVLSPAVGLWLRSQVEQVQHLQVKIEGGDRQILSGCIPGVSITAKGAVYQGLHLGEIQLTGTGIRINIGQVIKGKPLRLLEPIPVAGELKLPEADLNASLQAPLLANALIEFLLPLLQTNDLAPQPARYRLQNSQMTLDNGQLTLRAQLVSPAGNPTPFVLRSGLQLASSHELQFVRTHLQTSQALPTANLDGFIIDLGPEVDIQELTLSPGLLTCRGRLMVIPLEEG